MRRSQESTQGDINKNLSTFSGGGWSARIGDFVENDPNLEDLEMVQEWGICDNERSGRRETKEALGESETDENAISILGWGGV